MKKIVYLCAAALMTAAVACGGGQPQGNQGQDQAQKEESKVMKLFKAFPWDYPEDVKAPELVEGCHALVPKNVYQTTENPADELYIFDEVTIKKVGDKSSIFAGDTIDVEVPNSLVVPLANNQTAKVGDVLLTWWQTGSGSQRAIVTDATDPARPKVAYLDLAWDEDNKFSSAQKNMDQQLEAGTFTVLKSKEWQPGQNVVFNIEDNDELFEVISVNDSKVLALRFDGKIHVLDRSKCTVVPTDQQLKAGETVRALSFGSLSKGDKINKVDARIGRVWCDAVLGENCCTIIEVLK